jgi:transposase
VNIKQRGEDLRATIGSVRDGTFEYESREPPKTNWTKYDKAQVKEVALYLDNIRGLVDEAAHRIEQRSPPKKRGPGRPPVNPADIVKVLLMQTYFQTPNRVAKGFLDLFKEKLGIESSFSYKTIERGYDRDSVNEIMDEVTRIMNETVEGIEVTFSFDGTGFSSSNKENYAAKRQSQNSKKGKKSANKSSDKGQDKKQEEDPNDSLPKSESKTKRGFTYSVMGVGIQSKLVAGMAISSDHSIGETTMFPEAFQQTISYHPDMVSVLGDGIYAARWITEMVATNDVTPYFLPRSNATFKSMGYFGWGDMLISLQKQPHEWMEQYHMRSISETVNSMIKCRFGQIIRKRLDRRRTTETRLKIVGHDVRRVGYLEIFEEIVPHWTRHRI